MNWNEILSPVLATTKLTELKKYLQSERKSKNIYPEGKDVFRAFDLCPYDDTKIVILGQDPYPWPGVADGLAFSSRKKEWPKSLAVIFKEIYTDLNIQYFHNCTIEEFFPTSDLSNWTHMGILLLNPVLTVEENKTGSHKGMGWEMVTEVVFSALAKKDNQVLYLLWGRDAQSYKQYITNPRHMSLEAPHPAAELYGDNPATFSGCRHFSIVRDILPTLYSKEIFRTVDLDSCFDKDKAKKIVREGYPIEADKICRYIDQDLMIHVPVNQESYHKELRKIEKSFSTKREEPI